MTTDIKFGARTPSRRCVLQGGACAGAAALLGIAAGPAAAFGPPPGQSWAEWAEANTPKKSTQSDADYHVAHFDDRRCADCRNFMPPNHCAVVEGEIGSNGTCKLHYASRR